MDKIINFLYDASTYLMLLPIGVGFYFWKKLTIPFKIYLIGLLIQIILTFSSKILNKYHLNTHFLYYIMCITLVFMYSFFYQKVLRFRHSILIFNIIPIIFLIYLLIDYLENGIQLYFVMPFLFFDVIFLPCAIILHKNNFSKSIQILNLGILIYFCYDIPTTIITNYSFDYFQGDVFKLIFFKLSPIFTIIFTIFQTYAYYLASKQTHPNFDNNPNFR
jgi:hypothetical protein